MDLPPPPPAWRPTWRLWLLLAVLVAFALGLVWFYSDRDVAEIDRQAAALGVPSSWAGLALRRSPEADLAAWRRMMLLSTALSSYADATTTTHSQPKLPEAGMPLPAELITHHEALPATDVDELLALCDRFSEGGLLPRTVWDWGTKMPEYDASRRIAHLIAERVAQVPPHLVASEAKRILTVAKTYRPTGIIHGLVAISLCRIWQQAVSRRMPEEQVDRASLAVQAEGMRIWLATAMPQALIGEFVFQRSKLGEAVRGKSDLASALAQHAGLPSIIGGLGLGRIWIRAGRSGPLAMSLDMIALSEPTHSHRQRLLHMQTAYGSLHSCDSMSPSVHLIALLNSAADLWFESWAKCDAGLAVIAAEAGGTAWPVDPMDPAGGTVRRIERDGRLIGFYFVGSNGIDDGGTPGRDICFELYERLGRPRAGDPIPPPEPPPAPMPYSGPPPGFMGGP